MDTERLARKLRPLMPGRIDRWMRARETADAGLRELIDRQIAATARRAFGDVRSKVLLSLPQQERIAGAINLGTVLYDRARWPAGLRAGELLQGLSIFGRSGAGKSNLGFHVLLQLSRRGVPWVFLDFKRTARHLLGFVSDLAVYTPGRDLSPLPFNPFLSPPGFFGKDRSSYITRAVDCLSSAYSLGDGATSLLHRAIAACDQRGVPPGADEILEELERLPDKGRAHGWKASARRAIESLRFVGLTGGDPVSQEQTVRSLMHGSTVIELDALGAKATRFLVPLLCLWVYTVRLGAATREKLSLVIFIEEAHNVFYGSGRRSGSGGGETVMEMLLRQCREIGIGMVVIDQHPSLISPAVLGNTYTTVCLNLKEPADVARAAKACLVEEADRACFGVLPEGQAIVKMQDRWTRPFVVGIPLVPVPKGAVGDAVLGRWMAAKRAGSGGSAEVLADLARIRRVPLDASPLNDGELAFIEDVRALPDDGVRARYRRLGLSGNRGHRIREDLVRRGWLDAEVVPVPAGVGASRKVVLRVSREGAGVLGLDRPVPAESIRHEYWKRHWARALAEHGFDVHTEAPLAGGRVDVLATSARAEGPRSHGTSSLGPGPSSAARTPADELRDIMAGARVVAVEIETGRSDAVSNAKRCLEGGCDLVIVAATDERALGAIGKRLAQAGFGADRRICVVLRDRLEHPTPGGP